jgi:LCP family protein required for cell wall assembly
VRRRPKSPVTTLVVLLLCLLAGGTALVAYLFYLRPVAQAVSAATGQVIPRPPEPAAGASPGPGEATAAPTPPSLTGTSRVNILLLGSDTDAKFAGDYNTQIMIVVSIDPVRKSVSMLSVPRDLWVPIPGHGTGKIGVAYGAGGVALARQTIETNLGIPIHYYAWVGLEGFIKVIDTFGGVDVDVSHPIVDDSYPDDVNSPDPYAYRRLYIPAGPQHLDGMRALEYVRSRHGDLIGDFGRSQRQQQVLDALRSKSGTKDIIVRLPELANDLKDSVRTDMTLQDIARFASFAEQIRGQPVQQYTLLPPKYSDNAVAADGESIVVPNWPEIRPLIDQIFDVKTTGVLTMAVPKIAPPPPQVTPAGSGTALARPTPGASATPKASGTPESTPLAGAHTPTPTRVPPRASVQPAASPKR